MKNFKIKINEIHKRELNVQADNTDDAINKIKKLYESNEVLPQDSTLISVSIQNKTDINPKDILINEVVSYLYEDEKKHYEEFDDDKPNDHIFLKLKELSKILN